MERADVNSDIADFDDERALPHNSRPIQINALPKGPAGSGFQCKARHTSLFLVLLSDELYAGGLLALRNNLE